MIVRVWLYFHEIWANKNHLVDQIVANDNLEERRYIAEQLYARVVGWGD
jgi:hypothetical protein